MATKTILITTTGSGVLALPSDWNDANNTVEIWGAGGGSSGDFNYGSGGGGGGAYSKSSNVVLSTLGSIPYIVGAGGLSHDGSSGTAGGGTIFVGTTLANALVSAAGGGAGGDGNGAAGLAGIGGAASAGVGTFKFSGGNGGVGGNNTATLFLGGVGGGGGGAGGAVGSGNAGLTGGTATTGGTGGSADMGSGGAGGAGSSTNGSIGTTGTSNVVGGGGGGGGGGPGSSYGTGGAGGFPGGGGGGGANYGGSLGGIGGGGQILITYTPSTGGTTTPTKRPRRVMNITGTQGIQPASVTTTPTTPAPTFSIAVTSTAASTISSGSMIADTPSTDGTRMFPQGTPFTIVITTKSASSDTVNYRIGDGYGNTVTNGSFPVPATTTATTLTVNSTLAGYFSLTATLATNGSSITTTGSGPAGMVNFGVMPSISSYLPVPTYTAINQHRFGMQGWNDDFPHLSKLGISQVLDDRQMSFEEPSAENTFVPANNNLDPFYVAHPSIMRLIRLDGLPTFAQTSGDADGEQYGPNNLTYYQNYMSRVGTETVKVVGQYYPTQTHNFYQVTWEPDVQWKDTDANFIAMYKAAYAGLHSTDPKAIVMGPTCSFPSATLSWMKRLQTLGLSGYIDAVATHGYYDAGTMPSHPPERLMTSTDAPTALNALPNSINALRTYMQASYKQNMKLYVTETGISYDLGTAYGDGTYGANVLYAQAAVVARTHIILLGEGAEVTYPFFGPDYPSEVGYGTFFVVDQPQGAFGSTNNAPKPAAMAIAAMTAALDGTTTLGRVNNMTTAVFAYAFQQLGSGKIITAVWTHNNAVWSVSTGFSSTYSVPYTLNVDVTGSTGTVTVLDMMGNPSTVTYSNGQLVLSITESPQYIISTNASVAKQNIAFTPVGYLPA